LWLTHKKKLNPPDGRIEDCTLLSWSSIPKPRCLGEGLRHYATGRSSDFRITLLPAPSPPKTGKWHSAGVVPGYSGGTVTDLHRLPFYPEGTCICSFITSVRLLSREVLKAVFLVQRPVLQIARPLCPFSVLLPCAWSLEVIVAAHERLCGQRRIALYSGDWKPI
jgi:hypothetical protein